MKNRKLWVCFGVLTLIILVCAILLGAKHIWNAQNFTLWIIFCAAITLAIAFSVYLIRENEKNQTKLTDANQMFKNLISNLQGGVIICEINPKTGIANTVYANEGWTTLTGYSFEDMTQYMNGNPLAVVLQEDQQPANQLFVEQMNVGNRYELQYRILKKDGSIIWALDRGVSSVKENGTIQNQSIITEITEIKEREQLFRKLSRTDHLTELYNKATATMLIQTILNQQKNKLHALMILDVDRFKQVNDTMGHSFGDTVLTMVAARLKQAFGNQDVIGRIGGDEFIILMTDLSSNQDAQKKAEEVCDALRTMRIGEAENFRISCSLGIALYEDTAGYDACFKRADAALYQAKERGRDQFCVALDESPDLANRI